MRRTDEPRYDFKPRQRTTQIIYGERQHLRAVLVPIRNFQYKYRDLERETEALHRMIDARTAELHRVNPNFDEQLKQARDADAKPEQLARLSQTATEDDWLLLRTICACARASTPPTTAPMPRMRGNEQQWPVISAQGPLTTNHCFSHCHAVKR